MKNRPFLLVLFSFFALSNGAFAQTSEGMHYGAKETFTYWAGEEPWDGITVLNGQYWASAHFSKEYILYMEVIVPAEMAQDFIEDPHNGLEPVDDEVKFPEGAPEWFNPPKAFKEYKGGGQGSKYFIHTETGHIFMYEIQL